ncbi:MAG: hypothetical protein Q9225_001554 [Loekoesia sp. 1 TL-2023]
MLRASTTNVSSPDTRDKTAPIQGQSVSSFAKLATSPATSRANALADWPGYSVGTAESIGIVSPIAFEKRYRNADTVTSVAIQKGPAQGHSIATCLAAKANKNVVYHQCGNEEHNSKECPRKSLVDTGKDWVEKQDASGGESGNGGQEDGDDGAFDEKGVQW